MAFKSTSIVPNDKGCDTVATVRTKSKAEFPNKAAGDGEPNMANGEKPNAPVKYGFKKDEQGPDA